jgi:hypothetical protein
VIFAHGISSGIVQLSAGYDKKSGDVFSIPFTFRYDREKKNHAGMYGRIKIG